MSRGQLDLDRLRFVSYIEIADGCWIWQGGVACDKMGYGRFWMRGSHWSAHRAVWELFVNPIPPGACVLHRCDRPLCVHPDDLFLGTKGDNNRDRAAKGRTVVPLGERHGRATLTDDQALEIKSLRGVFSQRELARIYGVSQANISSIQRGRTRSAA